MKCQVLIGCFTLAILVLCAGGCTRTSPSAPRQILEKYLQTLGGSERVQSERSLYAEGTEEISGSNLAGTIKEWRAKGQGWRQEIDLGITSETKGWNGKTLWTLDSNAKTQIVSDDNEIGRRRIEDRLAEAEYLDPRSSLFRLAFRERKIIGANECYVVEISNTINSDIRLLYIDTKTWRLAMEVERRPDTIVRTSYSDYRRVGGIDRAFRRDQSESPSGRKTTIRIKQWMSNEPMAATLFEPPPQARRDFRFVAGDRAEAVPFQLVGGHFFLPVNIQGKTRMWIFDSGTTANVIDLEYAKDLGIHPEGSLSGKGATQTIETKFVVLPPYAVPGIKFESQKIAAIPMRELFRRSVGIDAAGILGYDFISRFLVKIDYAGKTLSFYDPETFVYHGNGTTLAAPVRNYLFTVQASVDGRYQGRWHIDTGSSTMDFHHPFAEKNGFLSLPGIAGLGGGSSGTYPERMTRFNTIEIGGFVIPKPILGWPMEKGEGQFNQTEIIGNLGNSLWRHFIVYLDYRYERIILEKGRDFDRNFPENQSGLQLANAESGELTVFFVAPGTPAEAAGLRSGDTILAANAILAEKFTSLPAFREMLRQPAGTRLHLRIKRQGTIIEKELILKDILGK